MPSYINGPFNYVQLSGTINNINKNITIFLDVHLDINNQTRCESFDSSDISQYLYKLIKHTQIPLDFFLEVREEQLQELSTNKKDIYIAEVIEMFKTEFIVEKDKVKYSKSNNNVRLHYLDIRDHLQFHHVINQLKKEIFPMLNFLNNVNLSDSYKIDKLKQLKQYIINTNKYTTEIFKKFLNIYNNNITKFDKKTQEYYLDKILYKYTHDIVKKKINYFFTDNIIKYNSKFNTIINEIILYIKFYKKNINNKTFLNKLFELYNKLNTNIYRIYALITDIYFLRRFLDKDYIQNVVTYCGRNHALNYIYFLVKYSNFTITKIYNTNGLTIDDIINKIKVTDDLNKVYNLFLFEGENPKQCVEEPHYNPELVW
jgi:hypothetical protein